MNKSTIIILLTLAGVYSATAQNIEQGKRFTRNEMYESAEKNYNEMIAKKPKVGDAYYFAGLNLLAKGDSAAARASFEKGLLMAPKYLMNQVGLGHLALRSGNATEAERLFNLALKSKKKALPEVYKEIGRAYLMVPYGSKATLESNATKASEWLKKNETDFEAALLLGDAYNTMYPNNSTKAVEQYIVAGYMNPNDPRSLLREAKVYQRVKNLNVALLRINEALAKDAEFSPAYRQKADVFTLQGIRDSAVYYYTEYLKKNNNLSARKAYISALYLNQEYDNSIAEARKLLAEVNGAPQFDNLHGVIAYAYAEKNDTAAGSAQLGLSSFEKYEATWVKNQNRPLSSSEKIIKAKLLARTGQLDQAFALQKAVLSDTATATEKWYQQTQDFYYNAEQYDKFVTVMELKKLKMRNLGTKDMYYYGIGLNQLDRPKEALGIFRELVARDTNYISGYYLIASTLSQIDQNDTSGNATRAYERWIGKLNPDQKKKFRRDIESANRTMAVFAIRNKRYEQASAYYAKVLESSPDDEETIANKKRVDDYLAALKKRGGK
ncbi:MAG: tetratricopeptide repeat protein [Bacteroidetes bacterium]|nr:tetratricopeptide repeat protein [Bacteroidota bacterium]